MRKSKVKADQIGQYVNGDSKIERAYLSIGLSEVLSHLPSGDLCSMRTELRASIGNRRRKVLVMRLLAASIGVLFLVVTRDMVLAAITQGHMGWLLVYAIGAVGAMWTAARAWFGADIDEHVGVVAIAQQQLYQIGALLDARGQGTGRQSLLDDMRGREPTIAAEPPTEGCQCRHPRADAEGAN